MATEASRRAARKWALANPGKTKWYQRSHMQRKRGLVLTRQQELALFEQTDGLCGSCLDEPATIADHDHKTKRPRGVLCGKCNKGIGLLGDTEEGLMNALEYIKTASLVEV